MDDCIQISTLTTSDIKLLKDSQLVESMIKIKELESTIDTLKNEARRRWMVGASVKGDSGKVVIRKGNVLYSHDPKTIDEMYLLPPVRNLDKDRVRSYEKINDDLPKGVVKKFAKNTVRIVINK